MTSTHDRFAALIGTWHTRGTITDGGELDGAEILGIDRYEWLGEQFIVHTADVTVKEQPQRTVEIFALEESRFEATAYTDDGSIEKVTGCIDDDGTYRADNDTTRVTLQIQPTAMTAHWELRGDDGQWQPWIVMNFTRAR